MLAFVLGVLGVAGTFLGLGLILGIPAIVLGLVGRRDAPRPGSRRLANAGVALGLLGSMLFFAWTTAIALYLLTPARLTMPTPPPIVHMPRATWPIGPAAVPEDGPRPLTIELRHADGPLRTQLAKQASSARAAGQMVLVRTTAPGCDACDEVARALEDPRSQAALVRVRLVDVDLSEFHSELGRLRMDEATAPWFYLLDERGDPRDAINADEWDDNDAATIAPILRAFVGGRLRARRHTWNGGATL